MPSLPYCPASLALLLATGLSCAAASENGSPSGDAKRPDELRGACLMAGRVGGFDVRLESSFTAVSGEVAEGVVPSAVPEIVTSDGECELTRPPSLFCDPPCGAGQTCGLDGSCLPYPANLDVGTVSILGLAADVTMKPTAEGNLYLELDLPHPGVEPGAELSLLATGGNEVEFRMYGTGVAPLVVPDQMWTVIAGQPLLVEWQPGNAQDEVALMIDIDQHATTPVRLACVVADTGGFSVDPALVQGLVDAGVSGFPNLTIQRRSADSTQLSFGCVDFLITSTASFPIDIEGHIPCTSDDDCPTGQSCDLATETCK